MFMYLGTGTHVHVLQAARATNGNQLKIALPPFPGHRGNPVNCFLAPRSCFLAPREDTGGNATQCNCPCFVRNLFLGAQKSTCMGAKKQNLKLSRTGRDFLFLGFGRASQIRRRETQNCFLALDMYEY